jgi:hypothetical protein
MARKRRRRRTGRTSVSSVRRSLSAARKSTPRRRKRRSGFLSGSKGMIVNSLKHNGAGALGGAAYALTYAVRMPKMLRYAIGFGGAITAGALGAPFIGAGMAGATAFGAAKDLLSSVGVPMLADEGMEDAEYVDADTLSDTGYMDDNGNMILSDANGNVYALNDNGELEEMGDAYSLNDGMQTVSMVPLSDDPYALSMASGY